MVIANFLQDPQVGGFLDWAIFLAVYVGIALGTIPFTRLDRASIALLGAVAVVATNRQTFNGAVAHLEFATLALLFSLMVLSAQLHVAGFYNRIIQAIIAHAHRPWTLLIAVISTAAILSALFANDIVCLVFAPVLCVALKRAGRPPLPYLMALATASNIGSAATIIGNPQNMLIGQTAHLSFAHYSLVVAPLVLVCLILNVLCVALVYRRPLFHAAEQLELPAIHAPRPALAPLAGQMETVPAFDRWRVIKTLLIAAALLAVFFLGERQTRLSREIAALVAAGLVMISRKTDPRTLLAHVDWNLILLFIGLFVVIGNVQQKGLVEQTLRAMHIDHASFYAPAPLSALTLLLSNIVSNVPAVLLLKPGIPLPSIMPAATNTWYLLAVVSTFAGNLTLLGSIANLIVAEQSKPNGVEIGFAEYLKVGVPLTICNTILAIVYFSTLVR